MIVIKKNRKKNNWEGLELNGKRMEIVEECKYLREVINNMETEKVEKLGAKNIFTETEIIVEELGIISIEVTKMNKNSGSK